MPCIDEFCGKYSVEHPRLLQQTAVGNCLSLCFIPTDGAPQSAAVSAHILLLILHDRQCVLRCLQVRTPDIRYTVRCNAWVPLKGVTG